MDDCGGGGGGGACSPGKILKYWWYGATASDVSFWYFWPADPAYFRAYSYITREIPSFFPTDSCAKMNLGDYFCEALLGGSGDSLPQENFEIFGGI